MLRLLYGTVQQYTFRLATLTLGYCANNARTHHAILSSCSRIRKSMKKKREACGPRASLVSFVNTK